MDGDLNKSSKIRVYISCIDSNINPSAGIGIAKSIREFLTDVQVIGVDYSSSSSGVHHQVFDEVVIQRPWEEIDLSVYQKQIESLLFCDNYSNYWISSLDVETKWLASFLGGKKVFLGPSLKAIMRTHKPKYSFLFDSNHFKIPDYLIVSDFNQKQQEHFCRLHDWNVYLKSMYFDAQKINNVEQLKYATQVFKKVWNKDCLFLQQGIDGHEVSLCFVSYSGDLKYVVQMQKKLVTPEGKTWCGVVEQANDDLFIEIQRLIKRINWNGAGEIECVRTGDGDDYIIDFNPRFPAWIYGATINEYNLPALLLSEAIKEKYKITSKHKGEFIRVVSEIKVNQIYPISFTPELWESKNTGSGKMASDMPGLSRKLELKIDALTKNFGQKQDLNNNIKDFDTSSSHLSLILYKFLKKQKISSKKRITPVSVFDFESLEELATSYLEALANISKNIGSTCDFKFAYSIKTHPDTKILKKLKSLGFMAEVISYDEADLAIKNGFNYSDIVWNGPGKFWPKFPSSFDTIGTVFFDSVNEAISALNSENNRLNKKKNILGFRLSIKEFNSRFGVFVDDYKCFKEMITTIESKFTNCKIGFHFHVQSSVVGIEKWIEYALIFLNWVSAIQLIINKKIHTIDFGGGWHSYDLSQYMFAAIQNRLWCYLKNIQGLERVIFEPGKALTENNCYLLVTVIGFRDRNRNTQDVICDGSIAEIPLAHHTSIVPYKVIDNQVMPIPNGSSNLLGRLCMENDVLVTGLEISTIKIGDCLVLSSTGAYNFSMSYNFGRGNK